MEIDWTIYLALTLVAMLAGFVDSIAGGGGLIIVPATLFAGIPPLHALGTTKFQASFAAATALRNYARAGLVDWRAHLGTVALVFVAAAAGALLVQRLDAEILNLIIPLLLILVAGYVLLSPRMTDEDAHQRLSPAGYAPVAATIGAYDGFFGPGTGSFFSASLVALRGHGLTRATGLAKLYNLTSNVASVALFAFGDKIIWTLGLSMAAGAMTGAWIGSHTAIRHGAGLIRPLLVAMSLALTARLLWGYFAG